MLKFLACILFTLISQLSFASDLHEDPQWLHLLRYNKGFFGYSSEIYNDDFFFSKEGRDNPKTKLEANIQELSNPDYS